MRRTLVLDVVGLTPALLQHAPALSALAKRGAQRPLTPILPAVTCSVQSTFTTGTLPREHGCVANGWYYRDTAEVALWKQSNALVAGEKIWDAAKKRDASFTCAKLFWWFNMYSSADFAVTPRPMYPADGRKIPDVHAHPGKLRDELQTKFGQFPLFEFWGPRAGIAASKWITAAAMDVWKEQKPTLSLVYLPHLDYDLQRFGPNAPEAINAVKDIDSLCGDLIDQAARDGAAVIALSEYGITPVSDAVHINRVLREAGLIEVRDEMGRDVLDAGASRAFAVADHQLAHVYVKGDVAEVKRLLEATPGIERVLDDAGKREVGLDHPRSGELVAISAADRWFSYYYWLDDDRAPDYARTVDIHRKPGYDPVELFLDPSIGIPPLAVGWRLAKRKLGFRTLLDVIPLDTKLVKGSHGRMPDDPNDGPLVISSEGLPDGAIAATAIKQLVLDHVFG
jgi:predicted AlkP superfamily pyrophosphatase or phosphodiesterase